eukprot:CAMPEP_0196817582 /NCGR_PEP_ID=MMETSP1362-20130617/61515_1 /TAXON_ID=163516 /ORGANISM="Leptocylindrus danicus, Strain CCMP1856" /LENGTH=256 /DNA_ID=CAMNT_0042195341 /DNA_START=94 /DNA_END=864 /DNA_ORIENTATION=+
MGNRGGISSVSAGFVASPRNLYDASSPTADTNLFRTNDFFGSNGNFSNNRRRKDSNPRRQITCLSMGILDKFSSFLNDRGTDFVKLDKKSDDLIGPGPAILIVNCPAGIVDDELRDMISDGVTSVPYGAVTFRRIDTDDETDEKILGETVLKVFEDIAASSDHDDKDSIRMAGVISKSRDVLRSYASSVPVIYFSGISNTEMIDTYNIIAQEIYNETGGAADAACAKLVKPAFDKSLRQVIDEITGDHLDAINMNR